MTYTSFVFLLILYCAVDINRNRIWNDDIMLWRDVSVKSIYKARGHYNLGISYHRRGEADLAIAALKEAIKIRPDYTDAHYNLGAVYQNEGLLRDALTEYEEVVNLAPESADVFYNLGLIYIQSNFIDRAIMAFQNAIRIKPDYTEAQNGLEKAMYLKQQIR